MVRDLGAGVPDRYKRSIFERFVSGKKAGIRGTGLGLAIVKRIAELHSGKVWVEDNLVEYQDASGRVHQEKRGSVFVLRIPRGVE
jgi:signal transduction histidine kinase